MSGFVLFIVMLFIFVSLVLLFFIILFTAALLVFSGREKRKQGHVNAPSLGQ